MQLLTFQVGEFRCLQGWEEYYQECWYLYIVNINEVLVQPEKNSTRRDYYAVTKGFPLVSAPVVESEFDDFKGAIASAPMYQDEFKWAIYNKDIPFTWKKGTGNCEAKETLST